MKKLIIIFTLFLSQACNLSTMHKIDTKEDMKILYSEIAELRKKLNLNHLEIDDTLEKVAKEYAIKLGENRTITHTLFGTTPMQRIHKYDRSPFIKYFPSLNCLSLPKIYEIKTRSSSDLINFCFFNSLAIFLTPQPFSILNS